LCTALRSEALVGFDADADLSVQLGYECLRRMLDAPPSYVRILPHLLPYTLPCMCVCATDPPVRRHALPGGCPGPNQRSFCTEWYHRTNAFSSRVAAARCTASMITYLASLYRPNPLPRLSLSRPRRAYPRSAAGGAEALRVAMARSRCGRSSPRLIRRPPWRRRVCSPSSPTSSESA
jgi:hypothetical protein